MKKASIAVGDVVTCNTTVAAYYSEYCNNDKCLFHPGTLGVVSNVDVPCVYPTKSGHELSFCTVDFESDATYRNYDASRGKTLWRCALMYDNIKHVPQPKGTVLCLRDQTVKSTMFYNMLCGHSVYYDEGMLFRVLVGAQAKKPKLELAHESRGNLYRAVQVFNKLKVKPGWLKRLWSGEKGTVDYELLYEYLEPKE